MAGLIAVIMILVVAGEAIGGGNTGSDDNGSRKSAQSSNETGDAEPPTPPESKAKATKTPKPKRTREQIKTDYAPIADIRELVARTGQMMGDKVAITGPVHAILDTGRKVSLGDEKPKKYNAQIQILIDTPDGGVEGIVVAYNGDTGEIHNGSIVTVWGTVIDTMSFVSDTGGEVTQPLLVAKFVEVEDSGPVEVEDSRQVEVEVESGAKSIRE
jgi:hypothetical protein